MYSWFWNETLCSTNNSIAYKISWYCCYINYGNKLLIRHFTSATSSRNFLILNILTQLIVCYVSPIQNLFTVQWNMLDQVGHLITKFVTYSPQLKAIRRCLKIHGDLNYMIRYHAIIVFSALLHMKHDNRNLSIG